MTGDEGPISDCSEKIKLEGCNNAMCAGACMDKVKGAVSGTCLPGNHACDCFIPCWESPRFFLDFISGALFCPVYKYKLDGEKSDRHNNKSRVPFKCLNNTICGTFAFCQGCVWIVNVLEYSWGNGKGTFFKEKKKEGAKVSYKVSPELTPQDHKNSFVHVANIFRTLWRWTGEIGLNFEFLHKNRPTWMFGTNILRLRDHATNHA